MRRRKYIQEKTGETVVDHSNAKSNLEFKALGELVDYKKGFAFKSADYRNEGVRIIRVSDTTYNSVKDDKPIYISPENKDLYKEYELKHNDLIVSTVGSRPPMYDSMVGKVIKVPEEKEGSLLNQNAVRLRTKSMVDQLYMYHHLKTRRYLHHIERSVRGNANQASITLEDLFAFKIPLPKLNEQQNISSILSTWDKAIELKERLIEQKGNQKKGLMKKLLTGELRLFGFADEWKEVKLGDVLKERKEVGYNDLELLAITSRNGVVRRTEVDIKDNSSADKSKYKRILPNDIGYNTMRMWQGVSGVSKYEGIVSPAYTILKPTGSVNSTFIGYLFKLPKTVNLFKRYSQGLVSDTLNLKYDNLKVINVKIPQNIKEQDAIAEVLECIDKEIQLLQSKRNYLEHQKKGLMQLLLTGKVSLKE